MFTYQNVNVNFQNTGKFSIDTAVDFLEASKPKVDNTFALSISKMMVDKSDGYADERNRMLEGSTGDKNVKPNLNHTIRSTLNMESITPTEVAIKQKLITYNVIDTKEDKAQNSDEVEIATLLKGPTRNNESEGKTNSPIYTDLERKPDVLNEINVCRTFNTNIDNKSLEMQDVSSQLNDSTESTTEVQITQSFDTSLPIFVLSKNKERCIKSKKKNISRRSRDLNKVDVVEIDVKHSIELRDTPVLPVEIKSPKVIHESPSQVINKTFENRKSKTKAVIYGDTDKLKLIKEVYSSSHINTNSKKILSTELNISCSQNNKSDISQTICRTFQNDEKFPKKQINMIDISNNVKSMQKISKKCTKSMNDLSDNSKNLVSCSKNISKSESNIDTHSSVNAFSSPVTEKQKSTNIRKRVTMIKVLDNVVIPPRAIVNNIGSKFQQGFLTENSKNSTNKSVPEKIHANLHEAAQTEEVDTILRTNCNSGEHIIQATKDTRIEAIQTDPNKSATNKLDLRTKNNIFLSVATTSHNCQTDKTQLATDLETTFNVSDQFSKGVGTGIEILQELSSINSSTDSRQLSTTSESTLFHNTTELSNQDSVKKFIPFTSTPKKRTRKNKIESVLDIIPSTEESELTEDGNKIVQDSGRKTGRKRRLINYVFNDSDDDINIKKKYSRMAIEIPNDSKETSKVEQVIVKSELVEYTAELSHSSDVQTRDDITVKKRGRHKRVTVIDDDDPDRAEKISKKCNSKQTSEVIVTCAVCNEDIINANWSAHMLRRHNNLAWKVGQPPLDLDDPKLVNRVLSLIYKKKLPLHCDICGEVKKSVGGLLSHKTVCNKSAQEVAALRVKCEFCGRTVMPVSMSAHLRLCKGNTNLVVEKTTNDKNKNTSLILDKSKRQAAVKADNIIQNLKEEDPDHASYWQTWFRNKEFWLSPELLTRIGNDIYKFGTEKCDVHGCNFVSTNAVAFAQHYQTCVINSEEELFVCKNCVTVRYSEEAILDHVKSKHRIKKATDGTFEVSEIQDEGEENASQIIEIKRYVLPHATRLTVGSIKFLLQNRYCTASTNIIYPPAYDWTIKFCREHFSTPNLYPKWKVSLDDWNSLDNNKVHSYLPPLKYSASINRIRTEKFVDTVRLNHVWKTYKLFETEKWDDGTIVIFCGGQIFAMAWLPTPFNEENVDQILAVSASSCSMDKLFTTDEVYCETDLIQFWNFGILKNNENTSCAPKLEFCIAHDYGPVRYLEWCPSGCYNSEIELGCLQRLGLLAVGCSNSQICIYSIGQPIHNGPKILQPKPVLKLVIETVLEESVYGVEAHVTKISWGRAAGHQFLAAGYANGMVAVFNLNTTSSLLKVGPDVDDVEVLTPYRVFKAHLHMVTVLHLCHLSNGQRWLITGSTDRSVKYWDLDNITSPISNFIKATVTDGAWVNHWLSSMFTFDDCCGSGPNASIVYQPRNFISDHTSTMYSNCHVCSIAGSEWTNGFIQGNVMGELQGYFPHQLFAGMENDKSKSKKKVMLGYVNLLQKDWSIQERIAASVKLNVAPRSNSTTDSLPDINEINNVSNLLKAEPLSYKEASEKYGLVFCDIKIKSFKKCHENINNYIQSKATKFDNPQPNIYPMQSINKVVFNPNQSSYSYVAAAYQIGLVRVTRLDFLNN